jgi:Fur family ferric uptake transcriptional regulator
VAERVRQTHPGINLSTVYRNLETLENVGLVQHTHLGHGGATYHAAEEMTHLHLVCGKCGSVGDAPIDAAANFVQNLADDYGFKTDVTHFAIYGTCSACVEK